MTGPAAPGRRTGAVAAPPSPWRRLRRLAIGTVAGWSIVAGIVAAFVGAWFARTFGDAFSWPQTAGPALLWVALWMVATPPLLLLAERVRFGAGAPWRRQAARLVLLGVAVAASALLHLLAYAAIVSAWAPAGALVNLPEPALFFVGRLRENLLVGTLLVAGALAWGHWRDMQRRELEAAQLAAQLSESRLHALSMELRPHFLFNTLNAISGMVWADQAKADAMVLQLSELLRRTLEAGESPTTSLADEQHALGLYLAIQQVRFGPRLTIAVDVPEALGQAEVPRFVLQPLVENAFQHGFGAKRGPVSLVVRAAREGDRLVLRVLDDGAGLPPDGALVESTGIGNMRDRLATLYGDDQSLALLRRAGGGTEVVVSIPWRAAPTTSTTTGA